MLRGYRPCFTTNIYYNLNYQTQNNYSKYLTGHNFLILYFHELKLKLFLLLYLAILNSFFLLFFNLFILTTLQQLQSQYPEIFWAHITNYSNLVVQKNSSYLSIYFVEVLEFLLMCHSKKCFQFINFYHFCNNKFNLSEKKCLFWLFSIFFLFTRGESYFSIFLVMICELFSLFS